MDVDAFAPRLRFFFVSQADFFEEVAKFRALRRVCAKIMKDGSARASPSRCACASTARPPPRR